jgi:hypothetical protein
MAASTEFSEVLADLLREEFGIDKALVRQKSKLFERKRKSIIQAEKMVEAAVEKANNNIEQEAKKSEQKTKQRIKQLEQHSKKRIALLKKVLDAKESKMIKSILGEIIKGVDDV